MIRHIKQIFIPEPIELSDGQVITPPKPITPYVVIILALAIMLAADVTGFKLSVIFNKGNEFFVVLGRMFPPDLSYLGDIYKPMMDTIKMSLLGSITGCVLALPVAVLSSSNVVSSKLFLTFNRVVLSILRTIPVIITALILRYIFGIGTFAGTVAIAIFSFSIVSKMLYEQIETVDMSAYEAIQSTGATKVKSFITATLPQILPSFISVSLYTFEINVRNAAILGYVGAGGIGLILDQNLAWREYDKVGTILIVLFITVILIETLSRYLRKRLS